MLRQVRPNRHIWVEKVEEKPGDAGRWSTAGAVAVFVHGSCANAHQFEHQVDALSGLGVSIVAFDALGCGHSMKPNIHEAYSPDEHYEDLASVVNECLQEYRQVVLIAHSFGCCLAARLAASCASNRLAALVMIGAFYPLGASARVGPPWIMRLPAWILGWLQPELTRRFAAAAFHPSTFTEKPALVKDEMQRSNANPPHVFRSFYLQDPASFVSPEGVLQACQVQELFQPVERYDAWLQSIALPTLIVHGEGDNLTPLAMGKKVAELILSAKLAVIPRAGHQVHQERPDLLNEVVVEFLGSALKA